MCLKSSKKCLFSDQHEAVEDEHGDGKRDDRDERDERVRAVLQLGVEVMIASENDAQDPQQDSGDGRSLQDCLICQDESFRKIGISWTTSKD